jgi:TolA-binding protein
MAAFLVCAVVLAGCGGEEQATKVTPEDVKEEAKEALQTATAFTAEQKEAYQKQIESTLEEYNQRMDELKTKAGALKGEARAKVNEQMEMLRNKREAAVQNLEQLKAASGEAWGDLKTGMDQAMTELQQAYDQALSHFKPSSS